MDIQKSQHQQNSKLPQESNLVDDATNLFYSKKPLLTQYGESLAIEHTFGRPTIRSLVKSNGNAFVGIFVMGLLNEFLSFVPNALNASEISLYAEKILAHNPNWTTADLVLCFKNGMDGKYGVVKYNWKWNVFVEWAQKYDQEKDEYFFRKHLSAKNQEHVDILKHIPKHILDKFEKVKFEDDKKIDRTKIKVPDEIIKQGVKAVDEWLDRIYKK